MTEQFTQGTETIIELTALFVNLQLLFVIGSFQALGTLLFRSQSTVGLIQQTALIIALLLEFLFATAMLSTFVDTGFFNHLQQLVQRLGAIVSTLGQNHW